MRMNYGSSNWGAQSIFQVHEHHIFGTVGNKVNLNDIQDYLTLLTGNYHI